MADGEERIPMLDRESIVQLMEAMRENDIDDILLSDGGEDGWKLRLRRQAAGSQFAMAPAPAVTAPAAAAPEPARPAADEPPGEIVTAPVVGIFYAAPSPESDPFVALGRRVAEGDVLCIIEAMKLMNEVTSTAAGEIAEIYVRNGERVEFGQKLFRIIRPES